MKRFGKGKYQNIVTAIALFIVLETAVLLANFYMASQFARDTELVNLAAVTAVRAAEIQRAGK